MSEPASEVRAQPVEAFVGFATPGTGGFGSATWAHWKRIAHAIGVVQTRVLMVVLYFIFVLPLGLVMRLRGDPLHLQPRSQGNWTAHRHQEPNLDSVHRQF